MVIYESMKEVLGEGKEVRCNRYLFFIWSAVPGGKARVAA